MHRANVSLQVFGTYLAVVGAGLLFAPALVLGTLGLPGPQDIWVRVLGMVTLVVAYYYWAFARGGDASTHRATVVARVGVALVCVLLFAAYDGPPQLFVFAAADLAGAAWTALALRRTGGR